ncbi:MAG: hypothetical protein COB85_05875 [Bacteroidetes bacterium]|nr:MAG: hypothetical protein COB85_05875 [Bacteroidota bacterium]
MNVPEIDEVKVTLDKLGKSKLIKEWELPYENLLTRLSAAIFFIEPLDENKMKKAWIQLKRYPKFRKMINEEKNLSDLKYRIEFNDQGEL